MITYLVLQYKSIHFPTFCRLLLDLVLLLLICRRLHKHHLLQVRGSFEILLLLLSLRTTLRTVALDQVVHELSVRIANLPE